MSLDSRAHRNDECGSIQRFPGCWAVPGRRACALRPAILATFFHKLLAIMPGQLPPGAHPMSRPLRIAPTLLLALAVPVSLAGCGNKGPLFLPPPAVQQPEPAASAPAATTSTETPAPESPKPAAPAAQ